MFQSPNPDGAAYVVWEDRQGLTQRAQGPDIFQALFEARYRGATYADGRTSDGNAVSFVLRDGIWRRCTHEYPEGEPASVRYR